MTNPYTPPESSLQNSQRRTFKTPLITPISIIMVIGIYVGYTYFHFSDSNSDLFAFLKLVSFEIFLGSQIGMVLLTILIKRKIDAFLDSHPTINNQASLDELKPVARTNMYSSLIFFFLLGLGSLAGIMAIYSYGGLISIAVVILVLVTGRIAKWGSKSEDRIKQIQCDDPVIEKELNAILHCWDSKPFPKF